MKNEELISLIQQKMTDAQVSVEGDGYHYTLKVVSPVFSNLTKVKRQQLVYQILHEQITSGQLHAVSIEALTPDELK